MQKKSKMNITTATIGGKKIRYSDQGIGSAIVLLHGFVERIEIWEAMSEELSDSNRVVCVELPGHGLSEMISETQTMEMMANHIRVLLNQLEVTDFVMIGHSMGGYIALAYATQYPTELKGVGLFHSQALADSDQARKGRERAIEIVQQDRDGFIFNFIPDLFAESNREMCNEQIKWLQKGAKSMSKEAIISCLKGMALRSDKLDFLVTTHLPVMFIFGKEDGRVSINSVLAQTLLPKHAEILILGDCGHMGYIEMADETTRFIHSFVANLK